MNLFLPASWLTKRRLTGVAGAAVFTLVVAVITLGSTAPLVHNGVPIPFAVQNKLTGAVTYIGSRNNIPVYDVTFRGDEYRYEFSPDRIYLVHIPNDPRVAHVPLDLAFLDTSDGHNLSYYGYHYSDAAATMERRDINALRFRDRFSHQFFASGRARAEDEEHGDGLAIFEESRGITFLPTGNENGAVYLGPASGLYVFVLADTGSLIITRSEIRGCGNNVIDPGEECDDGNTSNDDACTNVCQYYIPTPFGTGSTSTGAKLLVTVQALVQAENAEYGTPDIPLMRFDATASGRSIVLTSAVFNAQAGSLLAAENYALWKDTNADDVVDTRVVSNIQPQNSLVEFGTDNWTGATIPDGDTVRFEVHADVAEAPPSNTLQLRLATAQSEYIKAKETDTDIPLLGIATNSVCITFACHIGVMTVPSTLWNFAAGSSSSQSSSSSSSAPSGPALSVTLKDIGESQRVSPGQNEVRLLRFEVSAPFASVSLEDIILAADRGDTGVVTNYIVKADTNNDGIVDEELPVNVYTQNGRMHLDFVAESPTGAYLIAGGTTMTFELFADVPSEVEPVALQIGYFGGQGFIKARHVQGALLEGIRLNNDCPVETCEIEATSVPSVITFINAGSLFVAQGDVPPSHHLIGGNAAEAIGQITMSAAHEDISVTQIQLTLNGNGADSIAQLNILDDEGEPVLSPATQQSCGEAIVPEGTFCAVVAEIPFSILKDQTRILTVHPDIKSDADGGVSGTQVQLSIKGQWLSDQEELLGTVRATGVVSGAELLLSDGDTSDEGEVFISTGINIGLNSDIVFAFNTIGMAGIRSVTNVGDADGMPIPDGFASLGAFEFTAFEHGNAANGSHRVELEELHFVVRPQNVALEPEFTLMSGAGTGHNGAPCTAVNAQDEPLTGLQQTEFIVRCPALRASDINYKIDQGQSESYMLKGTVAMQQVVLSEDASLQIALLEIGSITNHQSSNTAFTWFDIDDVASVPFYWMEGSNEVTSTLYELQGQQ